MFYRKDAVFMAVASLLASSGLAMAGNTELKAPALSLDPSVISAQTAPDQAPLMWALDKAGAARPLTDLGLNVYGWVEAGYSYNHRHHNNRFADNAGPPILPGPFNHEVGNHFMLNQVDLRFERQVASDKFDVGGMVEVQYGTDAGFIHSSGMGFNGNDPTDDGSPSDSVPDKFRANYQFDVTQAYVDVNIPVGNGLKIRTGKFVTLLGYETIDPRTNPFYSHSWLFSAIPFTQTGILGMYQLNDQWSFTAGITRGWDMTLEDNGGCAIDGLGQIAYTPNKQWNFYLNWSVGPQNFGDTSHYRTVINPIVSWQVTDQLKLAAEGLYLYDGGLNAEENGFSHAYGDIWGAALYASYTINEYVTLNGRVEKYHNYSDSVGALGDASDRIRTSPTIPTINVYEATIGATITPFPKDPIGKNLIIRPEIRYDYSEDHIFFTSDAFGEFRDQLTFAADVIFKF
jgi:hypothetical protein